MRTHTHIVYLHIYANIQYKIYWVAECYTCIIYIRAHSQFEMYSLQMQFQCTYTGAREPVIRALGRDTGPPWRGVNSPIARFPSSWFPRVLRVIIHDSCVRVRVGTPKHSSSTKSVCVASRFLREWTRACVCVGGGCVCVCVSEASSTAPLSVLPDMRRAPKKRRLCSLVSWKWHRTAEASCSYTQSVTQSHTLSERQAQSSATRFTAPVTAALAGARTP